MLSISGFFFCMLQKTPDDPQDNCKQDTNEDHSGNGKIKAEIFPFNPDIARQPSDPVQLIGKEVQNNAGDNYDDAEKD